MVKKKYDNTTKPETWVAMGGVYCSECLFLVHKIPSLVEGVCMQFGYIQSLRAGSIMTGCNRGVNLL